jgi:hypothetical protein
MSGQPNSDSFPPVNHVFVDYENIQQFDNNLLKEKTASFTLLIGPKQTKLDVALVEKLMEHAASVKLVRLTSPGKDAVDFALAYYLGRKAVSDPGARFHIVSKDKGFDPLIEHLKTRKVKVRRHDDFASLDFSPQAKPQSAASENEFQRALEHLRKNANNRPKKKKTLVSGLRDVCGKDAPDAEVEKVVNWLRQKEYILIDDKDQVTYQLLPAA